MPDERTPKEIHEAAIDGLNELWKSNQIDFGTFRSWVRRADNVYQQSVNRINAEKVTRPEYVRNSNCIVCGLGIVARRIMNGWIIQCGCGESYRDDFQPEDNKLWKRRD